MAPVPMGDTAVVIVKVPDEVIGDPATAKIDGTVIATEVTVPEVAGFAQVGVPATRVRICEFEPELIKVYRLLKLIVLKHWLLLSKKQ